PAERDDGRVQLPRTGQPLVMRLQMFGRRVTGPFPMQPPDSAVDVLQALLEPRPERAHPIDDVLQDLEVDCEPAGHQDCPAHTKARLESASDDSYPQPVAPSRRDIRSSASRTAPAPE